MMIRPLGRKADEKLYYWLKLFQYKKLELRDLNVLTQYESYMKLLSEICDIIRDTIKKYGDMEVIIHVYADLYRVTSLEDELEFFQGIKHNLYQ